MDDQPTSSPDATALARDLLAWYRAVGVDDAVGEEAVDWLARGNDPPGGGFRLGGDGAAGSGGAGRANSEAMPGQPASLRRPEAAGSSMPSAPHGDRPVPAPASQPRIRPDTGGAPQPAVPASTLQRQFPSASPDEAVMAARTAAKDAASLDDLRARLEGFNGCALKATAKNLCLFRGAERGRLMLIGEAPGRDEDLSGMPFVGPAGQLLDKMLAAMGLGEKDAHITNCVYWRPPGNRTPSLQETQACRPFLDRQIELVAPDVIVLLGGAAANTVLGIAGGIMRLRGSWRQIDVAGRTIKVMPTLHPAFLLRSPLHKRQAWRDLLAVGAELDSSSGKAS